MARLIRIAAALIDDECGQLFLVRKRGTSAFMQAGGTIDPGESPIDALVRELREELDFDVSESAALFLGTFSCVAANEPDHLLEAQLFHIRAAGPFTVASELEEAVWVSADAAGQMCLAPLTRDHVLPLARTLRN